MCRKVEEKLKSSHVQNSCGSVTACRVIRPRPHLLRFHKHLRDALLTSVASLVTRGAPCSLCCGVLLGLAWAGTVEVHYGRVLNAVHK